MKIYFEQNLNRLVFINRQATDKFWDELWDSDNFEMIVKSTPNSWVAKETKKFLKESSDVLEGGCGRGQHVYALSKNGYKVKGLDFAEETVKKLKQILPDMIDLGDVRELPYQSNSFDGYWSLGVIEHFYEGYGDIISEAHRVLKPSGYLFLAFPSMSILRKLKSKLGLYPLWNSETKRDGFYQFALNQNQVINDLNKLGFSVLRTKGLDGLKGLKDEMKFGQKILSKIYNADSIFLKIVRAILFYPLGYLSNHSILIVAQK